MKKLTQLTLKTFIGPFVMTFFIALFILLMQFLWKYIDDLVGKGLEWHIVFQLMMFVAVTLVPLALPLAMLLSSIMTFGNLAEHFELVACKSAGMSVQRIMRPLTVLTCLICIGAFYFSNNVLPIANLKMNALLYDVRNQKPALYIKEGIFYNGIDGYVIKINQKDKDNQNIRGVMIYDHTENNGNSKLIMADRGKMAMSDDDRFLIINLFNGTSYEEKHSVHGNDKHPLTRSEFAKETIKFDLGTFKMTRTNEQLFKDNYQMLDLNQLSHAADSIRGRIIEKQNDNLKYLAPMMVSDSVKEDRHTIFAFSNADFISNFKKEQRAKLLNSAILTARNAKGIDDDALLDIQIKSKTLYKHLIEWHRKFTLSFACLILFFIGAPLGAIIRKGGLGMPMVISVFLFVTYHIISITSEKFAREGVIPVYRAMWISAVVLMPLGIFLTYKATTDSAIFDRDAYVRFFKKIINRK